MAFAQSSFLIKSWTTKGRHYNKIQGNFPPKAASDFHIYNVTRAIARSHIIKTVSNSTAFNVRRNEPELVRPTRPTPNKPKLLSDLDSQEWLLYQQSVILFYPAPDMKDGDPAEVIKKALAEALVYYYPWAGRIRYEGPFQKLTVDCTAEGVVFVEAEADISLEELAGQTLLLPPYPYLEHVLYRKDANTMRVFNSPILTMQVTRLSCGGFIVAMSFNHAMSDGVGLKGLLTTICELANGATAPSVLPVWEHDLLLNATDTRHTTPNMHHAPIHSFDTDTLITRNFSFNARHINTLRARMPRHLRHSTAFELIAGAIWLCRTIALRLDPLKEVCLGMVLSARQKFSPRIPLTYYGNTVTLATTISTAGKICEGGFSYAVEELKKARQTATREYKRSTVDPGILRGRIFSHEEQTSCIVSDTTMLQLSSVDFGWGKPMFSGPPDSTYMPHIVNFIIPHRNENGEDVKVVPVYLPADAMERFSEALHSLLTEQS